MLRIVENINQYKELFAQKFQTVLAENPRFRAFIYEVFVFGTAYVVGGYLRDILMNKESRDIDVIFTIPKNRIIEVLENSHLEFKINRLSGIKIKLNNIDADIWSIDNNWAFINNLVKRNDDYILRNIANGSFYNYDSLVLNVHTKNFNFNNYNDFVKNKTLDIIQKVDSYKLLNPTIEANILRAFYLRKLFNIDYSENCNNYLISRIGFLKDKYGKPVDRLLEFKKKYEKYDSFINKKDILETIDFCYNTPDQTTLNL